MGRSRVDSAAAEKACAAVRNGSMSRYAAAAAFGLSKTSLLRRLSGLPPKARSHQPSEARIYEANRMTSPEDDCLHKFYKFWQEFVNEHKPAHDHVWNTDESESAAG
ncbi:unnamed protein product [Ectocarpus sp. CCAP 1310/34]|nr:unnamed protein product [Ectocarpus sp. CCAP 1310/34]